MLAELRIADLGVIEEATLELDRGFTVVTGETGAGKTMVVSGLGRLALDDELAATLADVGGDADDGEVLVTRIVTQTRSRSMFGGVQVPVGTAVSALGEHITIHGQSEQIRLGTPERQREVLDAFGGPELAGAAASYRDAYSMHRRLASELSSLREQESERARELAMLEFGLAELEKAAPQPGEDIALQAEARRLGAMDDLRRGGASAQEALSGDDESAFDAPSALSLVAQARQALDRIADADEAADELAGRVAEVSYLLADVASDVASYVSGLDADPARAEWIAGRLAELQGISRRYGGSVDAAIAWGDAAAARVAELSASDERMSELETQLEEAAAERAVAAEALTGLRRRAASRIAEEVGGELAALALPHARLEFAVSEIGEFGPHGADRIDLLFAANPGAVPAPLAKVASGGELSRVRLALEVVLASGAADRTFVFDEVDAGVGGAVALEIGSRLARLAESSQVIVVTHLAQVAAFADRHYVVSKSDDGQVTTAGVREVTGDDRVDELARMMAGLEGTDAARAHALELLEAAGRR
jgi:DNA repair protein RecN (Recombination protein N)